MNNLSRADALLQAAEDGYREGFSDGLSDQGCWERSETRTRLLSQNNSRASAKTTGGEPKAYDPICFDVAEFFALGQASPLTDDEKQDLAAHIQQSIDDWLLARAQKRL